MASRAGSLQIALRPASPLPADLGDLERLRLLRGVRVVRTGVDLELLALGAAELVLRQHALDDLLQQPVGARIEQLAERALAQAAGVAAVPVGELLVALVASQRDLAGVDDDDEVARVHMRGERGL